MFPFARSDSSRALFISTLRFNLKHLETELEKRGLIGEKTTRDQKWHIARIAMIIFAGRVGGIAEAIRSASPAGYAKLVTDVMAADSEAPEGLPVL